MNGERTERKTVTIYTDGGCHGNPGPGGWGAILIYRHHRRELSGFALATTNNRMELLAAIEALRVLRETCHVILHTDSQYLKQGVTQWLAGWKRNGWRTRTREPVKNEDLWRHLDEVVTRHTVEWQWVKGHAGDEHNESCDALAQNAIAHLKKTATQAELRAALLVFQSERVEAPDTLLR
ncbi:MAG: ribonuclease HI [Opitutales bacterium]|nr:ribonuclease HI [Opitutales bacterium]